MYIIYSVEMDAEWQTVEYSSTASCIKANNFCKIFQIIYRAQVHAFCVIFWKVWHYQIYCLPS